MSLASVADLKWHQQEEEYVILRWTNPAWTYASCVSTGDDLCTGIMVDDYDIRFLPGRWIVDDASFYEGTRVEFTASGGNAPLLSSEPNTYARLTHGMGETCMCDISMWERNPESPMKRPQFRERNQGSYAIKYHDMNLGWSDLSNVIWDNGDTNIHDLEVRMAFGFGGSLGPIGASAGLLEIRDPYSMESQEYWMLAGGMGLGGKIPGSATEPLLQDSWVKFKPRRHIHAGDLDGYNIRILTQGASFIVGYSRTEIHIYHKKRYAAPADLGDLVAGPIDLDGWTHGYELTLIGEYYGTIRAR